MLGALMRRLFGKRKQAPTMTFGHTYGNGQAHDELTASQIGLVNKAVASAERRKKQGKKSRKNKGKK